MGAGVVVVVVGSVSITVTVVADVVVVTNEVVVADSPGAGVGVASTRSVAPVVHEDTTRASVVRTTVRGIRTPQRYPVSGASNAHTETMVDLSHHLASRLDADVVSMTPLGGGDVAEAYRVVLGDGRIVFAKTKQGAPPEFFITEAVGLSWLRDAEAVDIPEVIDVSDEPAVLILEWITSGEREIGTEAALGRSLARLHGAGSPLFGREDRRSTGSRGLPNEPCDSWAEFYAQNRLLPLARLASEGAALPDHAIRDLESVAQRIEGLVGPPEPPARLHGDLWGGNRMIGLDGVSWLIDPAAFGGDREFDLAMMRLFGGFGEDCFAAYAEAMPLADGWSERIPLHQLAPLTVHAIKFGGPYVEATIGALAQLG